MEFGKLNKPTRRAAIATAGTGIAVFAAYSFLPRNTLAADDYLLHGKVLQKLSAYPSEIGNIIALHHLANSYRSERDPREEFLSSVKERYAGQPDLIAIAESTPKEMFFANEALTLKSDVDRMNGYNPSNSAFDIISGSANKIAFGSLLNNKLFKIKIPKHLLKIIKAAPYIGTAVELGQASIEASNHAQARNLFSLYSDEGYVEHVKKMVSHVTTLTDKDLASDLAILCSNPEYKKTALRFMPRIGPENISVCDYSKNNVLNAWKMGSLDESVRIPVSNAAQRNQKQDFFSSSTSKILEENALKMDHLIDRLSLFDKPGISKTEFTLGLFEETNKDRSFLLTNSLSGNIQKDTPIMTLKEKYDLTMATFGLLQTLDTEGEYSEAITIGIGATSIAYACCLNPATMPVAVAVGFISVITGLVGQNSARKQAQRRAENEAKFRKALFEQLQNISEGINTILKQDMENFKSLQDTMVTGFNQIISQLNTSISMLSEIADMSYEQFENITKNQYKSLRAASLNTDLLKSIREDIDYHERSRTFESLRKYLDSLPDPLKTINYKNFTKADQVQALVGIIEEALSKTRTSPKLAIDSSRDLIDSLVKNSRFAKPVEYFEQESTDGAITMEALAAMGVINQNKCPSSLLELGSTVRDIYPNLVGENLLISDWIKAASLVVDILEVKSNEFQSNSVNFRMLLSSKNLNLAKLEALIQVGEQHYMRMASVFPKDIVGKPLHVGILPVIAEYDRTLAELASCSRGEVNFYSQHQIEIGEVLKRVTAARNLLINSLKLSLGYEASKLKFLSQVEDMRKSPSKLEEYILLEQESLLNLVEELRELESKVSLYPQLPRMATLIQELTKIHNEISLSNSEISSHTHRVIRELSEPQKDIQQTAYGVITSSESQWINEQSKSQQGEVELFLKASDVFIPRKANQVYVNNMALKIVASYRNKKLKSDNPDDFLSDKELKLALPAIASTIRLFHLATKSDPIEWVEFTETQVYFVNGEKVNKMHKGKKPYFYSKTSSEIDRLAPAPILTLEKNKLVSRSQTRNSDISSSIKYHGGLSLSKDRVEKFLVRCLELNNLPSAYELKKISEVIKILSSNRGQRLSSTQIGLLVSNLLNPAISTLGRVVPLEKFRMAVYNDLVNLEYACIRAINLVQDNINQQSDVRSRMVRMLDQCRAIDKNLKDQIKFRNSYYTKKQAATKNARIKELKELVSNNDRKAKECISGLKEIDRLKISESRINQFYACIRDFNQASIARSSTMKQLEDIIRVFGPVIQVSSNKSEYTNTKKIKQILKYIEGLRVID